MSKSGFDKRSCKKHLKTKVLLGVLVFAVVTGIGAATHAISYKNYGKTDTDQVRFLDPFKCSVIYVPCQSSVNRSGEGWKKIDCPPRKSPVIVPPKPRCRTPYRPHWRWRRGHKYKYRSLECRW